MAEYVYDFTGKYGPRYAVYERLEDGSLSAPLTVAWNPKQIRFFDSKEPTVLFGGGRGPGKTESVCWDAIFKARLNPGKRFIIFRRTMGELKDTIIARYKQIPEGVRGRYIGEMSNERCELDNGSVIRFASAGNEAAVRKILSGEYLGMYFDEWSEWPYAEWKFLAGSCRSTTAKNLLGELVTAQVKGATNPGGIGGDSLNRLFGCDIDKCAPLGEDPEAYDPDDYVFIQTLIGDNPAYSADTEAGRAYRKMLASQPRAIRDAWLYGKWSGFEGQYFETYEYAKVAIPHDTLMRLMFQQHWQPCWIALDWGKTHASYVVWGTFVDIDGITFPVAYRELLVNGGEGGAMDKEGNPIRGLSENALAQLIADETPEHEKKRVDRIYGSPDLGFERLMRGHKMGDIFVANGMVRMTAAFNERVDGWSLIYGKLAEENDIKQPWTQCAMSGLLIDDELVYPFEAIPWALASKKAGHDGDIDKEGSNPLLDVLDGLRYLIASRIQPQDKPNQQKIKEKLAALPVEGASRYIAHLKLQAEHRETTAPFYARNSMGARRKHGKRH